MSRDRPRCRIQSVAHSEMEEDRRKRKTRRRRGKTPREDKEAGCAVPAFCRRNGFLLLLVSCTLVGYASGAALRSRGWAPSAQAAQLIALPGQLVLRAFLMLIVPLLFCSLVLGVSSLRKGGDARMVALTIGFFLLLSGMSAVMGAAAGHLVHPGSRVPSAGDDDDPQRHGPAGRKGLILDSMLDLLWNGIPSNIVEAAFVKEYTHVEVLNSSSDTDPEAVVYKKSHRRIQGVNFMGLLTFSILFGCCLARLGDKGEQLHQLIEQTNAIVTTLLGYFLNLLPVGMLFWMLAEGLGSGLLVLGRLGLFLATALGCMALHQLVLLPCLYVALVRRNPFRFHLNLLPAMLTAFGTASSAATLPVTVRCAEQSNRLHRCVTRFVLPLGMVVHMNGPTLYMPLSALFLAQLEGAELGISETLVMCLTAVLLFVSAPGVPSGGNPVYLLTVMASAGISRPKYISLFLSVEWLMERFRTMMNVVGDSYVAAFVEKMCEGRLPPSDDEGESGPYPAATSVIRGYDREAIGAGGSAV